jgi:murein L,D-transpeptidase YcbB/YkuD
LIVSDEEYAIYEPISPYYLSLKNALKKYKEIEKKGGFPLIDSSFKMVEVGEISPEIIQLKTSLFLSEDLNMLDTSAVFTDSLYIAIKSFQKRMGLPSNGKLDKATLAELNTPIQERVKKIMINLERLRWLPEESPANYLLVNIPEFRLHVFESKKYQWSMDVVVGKAATETTIFSDNMKYVVFSPYWNVPQSIIRNELLPKLKRNSNYLNSKNMEVVQNGKVINSRTINWHNYSKGVPFVIREKPGKDNSLGLVKFLFPNQFNIYMHDTPAKSLFDKNDRAFSHGCIRLAEPEKLANYVLRNDTTYTPEKTNELMHKGEEKWVTINPTLPVFIVYFSSWVSHDGKLNFRKDIYGADKKLSKEVFGM